MNDPHGSTMTGPRPFHIDVSDAVLGDIRSRVERFPHDRPYPLGDDDDWGLGPPPAYLAMLRRYWLDRFDWRAQERRLNRLPQYIASIDGSDLHFVHEAGSGKRPRPLLLLHGWPYSFASFAGIVDALAHPEHHGGREEDAFTVVVPSLPGFGFSARPAKPMAARAMTGLCHRLMTPVLGLPGYIVHGGDWGGYMASLAGLDHPGAVKGVHTTYLALRSEAVPLQAGEAPPNADPAERAFVEREAALQDAEGAYAAVQSTKPLALAPAMVDSPVGVAAWIIDKFHAWSDRRERPFGCVFTLDQLLTEVMLYLVTGTVDTATWIYAASRADGLVTLPPGRRVEVPTAIAAFPDPVFLTAPQSIVAHSHNLVRYTTMPYGGHFPFYEAPELLVGDLRAFARDLDPQEKTDDT